MSQVQYYYYPESFTLESGTVLHNLRIAYHTYGTLNTAKNNVIWVCHALTADSDVQTWWPGMVGEDLPFDTATHFVVCANILGSCYGTSADGLITDTEAPLLLTIRDMAQLHILLRQHLQIKSIALLVGGSMGGYQALEWVLTEPQLIKKLFLIATSAAETAWGIAIHTAQRLAIEADPTWIQNGKGANGLKAARAIGMLVYRSYEQYVVAQTDTSEKVDDFKASSYIRYQGEKLVNRFAAKNYWLLTKSMDSHNIGRGRGGDAGHVLSQIQQPTLIIGISSDLLSPTSEQKKLAASMPYNELHIIDSFYGHDGFLTESAAIGAIVKTWLNK
jgi:homoserine O-acetyltransferase/O-succinyltransferase